jgi:DNA ligase-1
MSLLERGGESLLYTGDFKLRRGLSAEPCQPAHADTLIMETTYGRPRYRFPPTEDVVRGMVRFCREALDNDETPVLYGYSLGKSQEVLCALADAALPIMLHGAIFTLTKVYEQFGHCFPHYEKYEAGRAQGKVLLCPPGVAGANMRKSLGRTRCAVLTGWAVDPGCRYQYGCDAAFPISDHADFPELIEFVKQVQPKRVYTLHGFAADFAATLRGLGFDARALSEGEQMTLALQTDTVRPSARHAVPLPQAVPDEPSGASAEPATSFGRFAATCAAIADATGKLEKVRLLADYLRTLDARSVPVVAVWFTGLPFAASENRALHVGWSLLRDALCAVAGVGQEEFHHVYLQHSDLGATCPGLVRSTLQGAGTSAEARAAHPGLAALFARGSKVPGEDRDERSEDRTEGGTRGRGRGASVQRAD